MMRTFAILWILVACTVAEAQVSTRGGDPTKDIPVEVIHLKHAKSSDAAKTLSELVAPARITADTRLNAIIVQAPEDIQKKVREYLKTIDAEVPDSETQIFSTDAFQNVDGGGEIVKQIADSSGVKIAFDKDLGLVMVKGPKDEVSRTLKIIDQIKQHTDLQRAEKQDKEQKKADRLSAEKRQSEPFALRVFWLSNDPSEDSKNAIAPDAELTKSIEKLAELGFPNMKVKMQLLGRCEVIEGKAKCSMEGSLVAGDIRRTLNSKANLALTDDSQMNGEFKLEAGVEWIGSGTEADRTSAEVGINLKLKKYYILSATPVGGYPTAFVVQLIDGL